MSNLSPIEALKRIEQFSDSGDYATAIVKMKAIATEALAYKGQYETFFKGLELLKRSIVAADPTGHDTVIKDLKRQIDKLIASYKAGEDLELGVQLIAKERKRQIEKEGWTPEHDAQHRSGKLAIAAAKYAIYHTNDTQLLDFNLDNAWPWDDKWWKPSSDPIKNLVKAGALIAAEIDRLSKK